MNSLSLPLSIIDETLAFVVTLLKTPQDTVYPFCGNIYFTPIRLYIDLFEFVRKGNINLLCL